MISIIGSIIGFSTAIIPEVLNLIKDKNDKKHELEMLDKQIEINMKRNESNREILNNINHGIYSIQSSLDSNDFNLIKTERKINFSDIFNSSVRPMITYLFFGLFIYIKIFQIQSLDFEKTDLDDFMEIVWDEQAKAMFSIVIAFWFGQRQIEKMRNA